MTEWRTSLRIASLAAYAGFGAIALMRSQGTPEYSLLFLQCSAMAMLAGGLWLTFAVRDRSSSQRRSWALHALPALAFLGLCASAIWLPTPNALLVGSGYAAAAIMGVQVANRWEA